MLRHFNDLILTFLARRGLLLFAAADTESVGLRSMPSEGLRPAFGTGAKWLHFFFDEDATGDTDDVGTNLEEANDTFIFLRLARNTCVLDVQAFISDWDTHATETIALDVVLNAAVDGNAAADFNLIDADTTAQDGGRMSAGDGTSPDTSVLGKRIESDGATMFLQTSTAPATAATSGRQVLINVLVGDFPA